MFKSEFFASNVVCQIVGNVFGKEIMMLRYSTKKLWLRWVVVVPIFISFGNLFSQNYIDSLQDVDNSVPSTYLQEWNITRKAPYLIYNGNPTQMKILWQLTSASTCTLDWGLDSTFSTGSAQTVEYGNDHQHSYVISNLQASTKYFYRVTAGIDIHYGSFYSAPDPTTKNIKFFAYGDTRSYPSDHNIIAAKIINEFTSDSTYQSFIISVGDLVSSGDNESDWDNQFFNPSYPNIIKMLAHLPYQSCMGNHEQSGILFKKYFPYPFVNSRYWSFDYGPAHFVVVDQYTSYTPGSTQLTWIENDLASTNKPWKFVYLHAPGWSAGGHSNNSSVQNYIQPLCEQYGVPIVFGGHNHYYARAEVNDIQHITTGGGGAPLYTPDPTYPNIITAAQVHHYCKIEIEGDVLYFSAINENGNEIDNFVVNKYGIKPFNVSVSSPFAQMGLDTLLLLTEIKNPNNHTVNLQALLNARDSTFTDSVQLYDDGLHGDGGAGDGIWGNFLGPLLIEDEFLVDLAITDLDSGMYFIARNMARFTTLGPVILHDYTITSSDTIPNHNDRLKFQFTLKNLGVTGTAKNITSQIIASDSCALLPTLVTPEYGDITAGGMATGNQKQYIKFSLNCPDSIFTRFSMDIFSNDFLFWSDTFSVFVTKDPSGILARDGSVPKQFVLKQNYPNPFNPNTTIEFSLPTRKMVTLKIYNALGQVMAILISKPLSPGNYKYAWNASGFASGDYYYRLEAGKNVQTRKLILLK